MHSLSMAQSILHVALSEAKKCDAKLIKAISMKVEDETFAEADSLQICLEVMARGTIAEGANIQIECVSDASRCPECAFIFPVEALLPICPQCGSGVTEMFSDGQPLLLTLEID